MTTGISVLKQSCRCVCLIGVALSVLPVALAQSGIKLKGQVLDANTNIPIARAQVSTLAGQSQGSDITDERGRFDLQLAKGVEPGSLVRIRVNRPGYSIADQKEIASSDSYITIYLSRDVKPRRSESLPANENRMPQQPNSGANSSSSSQGRAESRGKTRVVLRASAKFGPGIDSLQVAFDNDICPVLTPGQKVECLVLPGYRTMHISANYAGENVTDSYPMIPIRDSACFSIEPAAVFPSRYGGMQLSLKTTPCGNNPFE